jgi:small-conductance mechanosensitive channel
MVNAISDWHVWAWSGGVVVGAVLIAAVGYRIIFLFLNRIARREGGQLVDSLIHRAKAPLRWILPFLALLVVLPVARLPADVIGPTQRAVGLLLIFAVGRLVIVCNSIIFDVVLAPHRLDLMDDLAARRMQTQVQILRRIALVTVAIVTLSLMLMTFPEIRHISISLLASAGLAGLIMGTAMKSSISNLIAGIQIALTQPIRLEDSVVVEGEWG